MGWASGVTGAVDCFVRGRIVSAGAVVAAAGAPPLALAAFVGGAASVGTLDGAGAPRCCLARRSLRPGPERPLPLPRSASAPAACCSPPSGTAPPRLPRFSSLIFLSFRFSASARLSSALVTARTTPPFAPAPPPPPPLAFAAFSRRSLSAPRLVCSRTRKSTIALRCTAFTPLTSTGLAAAVAGSAFFESGVASAAAAVSCARKAL